MEAVSATPCPGTQRCERGRGTQWPRVFRWASEWRWARPGPAEFAAGEGEEGGAVQSAGGAGDRWRGAPAGAPAGLESPPSSESGEGPALAWGHRWRRQEEGVGVEEEASPG